jgi:hypothetical protein
MLFGLLALAACTTTHDCTLVGCIDAVNVVAPKSFEGVQRGRLRVCVDDRCKTVGFGGEHRTFAQVIFPGMHEGQHTTATLRLPDGSRYAASGDLQKLRPNGPHCDPECIIGHLVLRRA